MLMRMAGRSRGSRNAHRIADAAPEAIQHSTKVKPFCRRWSTAFAVTGRKYSSIITVNTYPMREPNSSATISGYHTPVLRSQSPRCRGLKSMSGLLPEVLDISLDRRGYLFDPGTMCPYPRRHAPECVSDNETR